MTNSIFRISKNLSQYLYEIHGLQKNIWRWQPFVFFGLITTLPLVIGALINQRAIGVFGSLFAFLLLINDVEQEPLKQRLKYLSLAAFFMILGTYLGLVFHSSHQSFLIFLGLSIAIFSMSQGLSVYFERATLFYLFHLITMQQLPDFEIISLLLFQFLVSLFTALTLLFFHRFRDPLMCELPSLFDYKNLVSFERKKIVFIFITVVMSLLIFTIGTHLHIEKTYWILGTFLIVYRFDAEQAIARSLQRLIGTLFGCLLGLLLLTYVKNQFLIFTLIFVFAGSTPWGLVKNYWLGTFFITLLVLMLLDELFFPLGITTLPMERILATCIGCGLALAAVFIRKVIEFLR